jgi:hypothetical protein
LFLSLLEEGIERRLCDRFVDLRFCAAGGNTAEGLAVDLDGQSALVGEEVRESEDVDIAFFQCIGAVFRGTPVKRRVAGFPLGEFQGVERRAIRFL